MSAEINSGQIWLKAPNMQAITRLRISPWLPAGAGWVTLTIVPSGAMTLTGRNEP